MRYDGRTALVTGGSAGIGLEIARALSAGGAHVVLVARDESRARAAAEQLPGPAETLAADLSRAEEQDRLVAEAARRWPELSLLVNNAGMQVTLPETGIGDNGQSAAMRAEIALNLEAPALLSFGLMPLLARQAQAAIVNISSGLAIAPQRGAPVYCATKAGLSHFSRALRYRCEDAAPSIRVVDVVMAYVDTDMTRARGGRKMPASEAARAVLQGLADGRDTIWVGQTRLLSWLDRLAPALAGRVLRNG